MLLSNKINANHKVYSKNKEDLLNSVVCSIEKALQPKKSLIYGSIEVRLYLLARAGVAGGDLVKLALSKDKDFLYKTIKAAQDYANKINEEFLRMVSKYHSMKKTGVIVQNTRSLPLRLPGFGVYATGFDGLYTDGLSASLDSVVNNKYDFILHKDYFLYDELVRINKVKRKYEMLHRLEIKPRPSKLQHEEWIKYRDSLDALPLTLLQIDNDKLFKTTSLLDSEGVLCLISSDTFFSKKFGFDLKSSGDKETPLTFIELLESYGLYVNAILGLNKSQRFPENIYIFSKNKTKSLFVQEVTSNNYSPDSLIDFLQVRYDVMPQITQEGGFDLDSGFIINKNDFQSFSDLKAKNEVRLYERFYRNYKVFQLKDLIVNLRSHNEDYEGINTNEIIMLATYPQESRDIVEIPDDEVTLNYGDYSFSIGKNIIKEYLVIYFQSKFGEAQYKSYMTQKNNSFFLAKESLEKIPVFVPSIEMQEKIILADEKVKKLQNLIGSYRKTLALNPSEFIAEPMEKIDEMLLTVGQLNDAERIETMVRKIENTHLEFKETWKYATDLKEGQNRKKAEIDLKHVPIKVICSFLNSDGGSLIIGIHDKTHEILGINKEISYKYGDKTIEEQLDKFNGDFWKLLENSFLDVVIQQKLIEPKIVKVRGVYVYEIQCKPSKNFVCVIQSNNMAYKRVGSDSVPMDAQEIAHLSARLAIEGERERNKS